MKSIILIKAVILALIFSSCGNTEESVMVNVEPQKEVIKDYDYYLKRIAEDEEWMLSVEKQAQEKGVSVDSSLSLNAKHMAIKNGFNDVIKDYNYYLERISKDSIWMIGVKNQADEKGISIDSALSESAEHMVRKNGF